MATYTTNYNLKKPATGDFYDIADFNNNADAVDSAMKDIADDHSEHLGDFVRQPGYAVTGGSANAYTVSTTPAPAAYVDGMGVVIRVHAANTGASTVNWNSLGAKAIVDGKGNALTAGKLPLGGRIALRYSSAAGNFQLLGEGGEYGTAGAPQVLTGYSLGTESGVIPGTMPDRGSVGTQTLTSEGQEYTIAEGYHNGLGKVKAAITNLAATVIKAGTTVGGILGTFTSDATATASQILSGITAYVNGSKITGTMSNNGALGTYTPGTSNQTIPAGYTSGGTVAGDADLVTGNIKSGANIFGVAGKTEIVDTTEASVPASASNILDGKKAYVNGSLVTGSMPDRSGDTACVSSSVSGTTLKLKASEGYRDGTNDNVTITDADFIAGNIKSGVNIFGLAGNLDAKQTASGTGTSVNWQLAVTGLSFQPRGIAIINSSNNQLIGFFLADFSSSYWYPRDGSAYNTYTSVSDGTYPLTITSSGFTAAVYQSGLSLKWYAWS